MADSCDEEHLLHKKYVADVDDALPTKETQDYIDYFEKIFRNGSFEEKVVALAPCFVGYAEFGRNICRHNVSKDNPYFDWIQAYNSDSYVGLTLEYIKMLDSFGIDNSFFKFSKIFKEVSNLEICFFNQML